MARGLERTGFDPASLTQFDIASWLEGLDLAQRREIISDIAEGEELLARREALRAERAEVDRQHAEVDRRLAAALELHAIVHAATSGAGGG